MENAPEGKLVTVLVDDGFEQAVLEEPYNALTEAGASVEIISPNREIVRAWAQKNYGAMFKVGTRSVRPIRKTMTFCFSLGVW